MDRKTRKMMTLYGTLYPKSDVGRVYAARQKREKGLGRNASLHRCKEKKCMVNSCGKCQRQFIKIRPGSGLGKVT